MRRAQIASACATAPEAAVDVDPFVVALVEASELAVEDVGLDAVAGALGGCDEVLVAVAVG